MAKTYTEVEMTMMVCFATMSSWQFTTEQRRTWTIWASRHQECKSCRATSDEPCLNLTDIKAGRTPKVNKWPHDSRVDWNRFLRGLKDRGYYRPAIEAQIRRSPKAPPQEKQEEFEGDPASMPEWAK